MVSNLVYGCVGVRIPPIPRTSRPFKRTVSAVADVMDGMATSRRAADNDRGRATEGLKVGGELNMH